MDPSGLKLGKDRPLPNLSAAMASRLRGLTWFGIKTAATKGRKQNVPQPT